MIYLTCSFGIDDEAIIDIDVLTGANQLSSESYDLIGANLNLSTLKSMSDLQIHNSINVFKKLFESRRILEINSIPYIHIKITLQQNNPYK